MRTVTPKRRERTWAVQQKLSQRMMTMTAVLNRPEWCNDARTTLLLLGLAAYCIYSNALLKCLIALMQPWHRRQPRAPHHILALPMAVLDIKVYCIASSIGRYQSLGLHSWFPSRLPVVVCMSSCFT